MEKATSRREGVPESVVRHLQPRITEIDQRLSELNRQESQLPEADRNGRSVASKKIGLEKRKLLIERGELESKLRQGPPEEAR